MLALIVFISFAACSGSSGNQEINGGGMLDTSETGGPGNDPAEDTTIYYEPDELPDNLDFGGETINVLQVTGSVFTGDILSEELTSEPVNDSVFNRQKYVEDRLGIEITGATSDYEKYNELVLLQHASDDNTYQIFSGSTVWYAPIVFDNCVTDLYELDYLDFEKPWWFKGFTEEAEMGGRLFLATGSLSLSTNRFLFGVYYNKKLAEDYKPGNPDLGNLYEIVDGGSWTYDRMRSITSDIYSDLNGDSLEGEDDIYGLGYFMDFPIDAVWSSFDMRILGRDEDGWYSLDVNKDKVFGVLDLMTSLLFDDKGTFEGAASQELLEEKFAGGTLLFMVGQLKSAENTALRNMQDDYGLIPFPKYDNAQKDYYTYAHDQYVSFSIPRTNPDPDTAAAVLEAMASFSYRDTIPKYLDTVIKGKYMSDAKSRRMVDLIVEGFRLDAGWIYSFKIGYFPQYFRSAVADNSTSYASSFTRYYNQTKIGLAEIKKKYSAFWEEQ